MKLKIIKAVLLRTNGADNITLYTDLPCPYTKEFLPSQDNLVIEFETSKDQGIDYVRKNFHLEPEIIDVRSY